MRHAQKPSEIKADVIVDEARSAAQRASLRRRPTRGAATVVFVSSLRPPSLAEAGARRAPAAARSRAQVREEVGRAKPQPEAKPQQPVFVPVHVPHFAMRSNARMRRVMLHMPRV